MSAALRSIEYGSDGAEDRRLVAGSRRWSAKFTLFSSPTPDADSLIARGRCVVARLWRLRGRRGATFT